jgi:MFS family permease
VSRSAEIQRTDVAGEPVGVLRLPGFAGLWLSAGSGSLARVVTQVGLSWLALELTGSPFLVGVILAARMLPHLALGMIAGVLADWFERRHLLIVVNGLGALVALALVGAGLVGGLSYPALLVGALVIGSLDAVRVTTTQTYVFDLTLAAQATRGLALTNFGVQLFGVLGGAVGGYVLAQGGATALFGLVGLALAAAALTLMAQRGGAVSARSAADRIRPDPRRAVVLLFRNRLVGALSLAILLTELFGFSNQTLLPTVARDVFDAGPGGLGTLLAVRSAGGMASLLLLARLGTGDRTGGVLLGAIAGMGLSLVAFAGAPSFELAVVAMALVGGMGSAIDSLGQTLVQRSCAESERGAAMGIWAFSIGFAPLGHLSIGATANALGVGPAQVISGTALVLVAAVLARHTPIRKLR